MQLDIRGLHYVVRPAVREHAERRIETALDRFAARIRGVSIRLSEANGRHRVSAKRCLVTVKLKSGQDIVADYTAGEATGAIDEAAHHLKEALARRLTRRRSLARGHRHEEEVAA